MKADHPIPHTDTRESIAYAQLVRVAHEEGLESTTPWFALPPGEHSGLLPTVRAAVETDRGNFEGLGDADPGNVDAFLVPHLIRVAETRAKARALRDAANCGVVSSGELDDVSLDQASRPGPGAPAPPSSRPARNEAPPARPRGNGGARS